MLMKDAMFSLPTIVLFLLTQGASGTPKRSDALNEKVEKCLAAAVDEDASKRRSAVERLVALGNEAVGAIEGSLQKGNHHISRAAAIALGEIADEASGKALLKFLSQHRAVGTDPDIAVVALYGLGGCPGENIADFLLTLCDDSREADQVRAAAALAYARRSDRKNPRLSTLFQKLAKHPDGDPEVFAGLILAISRNDVGLAESKIPGILKDASDPIVRCAAFLALANIKKPASVGSAQNDLRSTEVILARCAILGVGEAPRKGDNSAEELREARIVALGLGAGDATLATLASSDAAADLRKVWMGALAERGWTETLVNVPWKESEIGENGRFAAAALLAIKGGFNDEDRLKLAEQAKARWNADPTTASGAALLLASLHHTDAEPLLAPPANTTQKRPAAVRLAWKHLRGELDKRRFEQAVYSYALSERVLSQGWLSDAELRLTAAILGHGSAFFLRQPKLTTPMKALLPEGMNRRKRTLATEHPMYGDLWYQLTNAPFDAMLMFPRDEAG